MVEDAPVNTGALLWPSPEVAALQVRRMQLKLHRWAREDPARCFGDLYNLVYDPAFLVDAFARVAGNQGAKTAGEALLVLASHGIAVAGAAESWTRQGPAAVRVATGQPIPNIEAVADAIALASTAT